MSAPTRRAILGAGAGTAALAATAGAIPAYAAADPVLELVAQWHRDFKEHGEAAGRFDLATERRRDLEDQGLPVPDDVIAEEEAAEAAQDDACERQHITAVALVEMVPTTLVGLAGKARIAAWYQGIEFQDPVPDLDCIDRAFVMALYTDAERLAAGAP